MQIGMMFQANPSLSSLKYVAGSLVRAVSAQHELVFLPGEHVYMGEERSRQMVEGLVGASDVLVGIPAERIVAARQRMGSTVPMVGFLLGSLSRGAHGLRHFVRYLNSNDVFLVNCTADAELASRFFENAQVRLLPFAFDERVFYPLDAAARAAAREKLGFRQQDRVVLYSGRVTLEKNVLALLRTFSAVYERVPDACLVIAGVTQERTFNEFGVDPVNLPHTLRKVVTRLGIPEDRVRLLGPVDGTRLRELYNVADVKVNMTLHHDENFGMSQVEAMACGTPVVGTVWGGLRDTIVPGTSGYGISTSPTPSGVKVNWWEAVNRIVELLCDPGARERFRESCVRHAAERYSQACYEAALLEIISSAAAQRGRPAEPLRATAFAEEIWSVCDRDIRDSAPYRRGPRSFALYQELMVPFTGQSADHVPPGEPLAPEHVVCLASPIIPDGEGAFRIDDPMYPFDVQPPEAYADAFRAIVAGLRDAPATTVEGLVRPHADDVRNVPETVAWMLDRGLLLRMRPVPGWLSPAQIGRRMSEPLFQIERLDRMSTDFVVF